MNILAYKNASKIDSQLVYFINILINFCHVKNDIVFAIEKAIPYLLEPLKTFCIAFVNEVRYGISPFDALENLKNKVDNKKFKLLIKNLQLCCKYDNGSFVEVLSNFNKIMKDYTIERDRRKSEVRKSRGVIYLMMLISFAIMYGLIQINPYLIIAIRKEFTGQLIVFFNIFVYLFAVYKSITIEKFDY
ncbi:MAG: hypothetical protein N2448_06455 [Caloramator sp.]|nr:hypothetical protein [Caloramator sp.]